MSVDITIKIRDGKRHISVPKRSLDRLREAQEICAALTEYIPTPDGANANAAEEAQFCIGGVLAALNGSVDKGQSE